MEEWLNLLFWKNRPTRITPRDNKRYFISKKVIEDTEHILLEYRNIIPSNEGMVFWAGIKYEDCFEVKAVIVPETTSLPGRVTVPPESNFHVVRCLSSNGLIQLGQVHSHPGAWVDHSEGDDEWASFKRDGLLSIVVPSFGGGGMVPLKKCGVHRFDSGRFIRLSNKYVKNHFFFTEADALLYELRNKKDYRWKHQNGMS